MDEPTLNLTGTLAMAKTSAQQRIKPVYFNTIDNLNLDGFEWWLHGVRQGDNRIASVIMTSPPCRGLYTANIDNPQTLSDWPTTTTPRAFLHPESWFRSSRLRKSRSYSLSQGDQPTPSWYPAPSWIPNSPLTLSQAPPAPQRSLSRSLILTARPSSSCPYCVLDLEFRPLLSRGAILQSPSAMKSQPTSRGQSSMDGRQWSRVWRTEESTTNPAVIARSDLGDAWQLTEDSAILPATDGPPAYCCYQVARRAPAVPPDPRPAILLFLVTLVSPARSQILADFEISLQDKEFGRFTIQLDQYNSPHATANFIRLAEGLVPWVDGTSGRVRTTPYYDGLTFHSLSANIEIASGSRNASEMTTRVGPSGTTSPCRKWNLHRLHGEQRTQFNGPVFYQHSNQPPQQP